MPGAPSTARARVRAELTGEILAAARVALAEEGAAALSLRAVARQLGMVPSALYRYYASRDDLLTALIVEAYDELAGVLERARDGAAAGTPTGQWLAVARALRTWAGAHPQRWALLYGSPVPGYQAPELTIPSALRAPRVLVTVAERATAAGRVAPSTDRPVPPAVAADMGTLIAELPAALPPEVAAAALAGWMQLVGAVSLELFGHLKGAMEDPGAFFDHVAVATAGRIGLAD